MSIEHLLPSKHFINQMPGLLVISDLKSCFISANETTLKWTGFKSAEALIGKTYADMPCKASQQHEHFINQDKAILVNKGHGRIFGMYCYDNDNWKIILAEKYPIKNEDNEIVALVSYITDMTHSNILDVNKFISLTDSKKSPSISKQQGFIVGGTPNHIPLTPRQYECLFFLIRGKTSKAIAEVLNISVRTIEDHIDQLKNLFYCQNKYELIDAAISAGYMNLLPPSLLKLFNK